RQQSPQQPINSIFLPTIPPPPRSTPFPYTTLFRSPKRAPRSFEQPVSAGPTAAAGGRCPARRSYPWYCERDGLGLNRSAAGRNRDRKSTRLNSSHVAISYAVFCLKKKKVYTGRLRG